MSQDTQLVFTIIVLGTCLLFMCVVASKLALKVEMLREKYDLSINTLALYQRVTGIDAASMAVKAHAREVNKDRAVDEAWEKNK